MSEPRLGTESADRRAPPWVCQRLDAIERLAKEIRVHHRELRRTAAEIRGEVTMAGSLAINGGEPVAKWEAPRWPVSGLEEERRLLQVLHDGPWAGGGPMESALRDAWAEFCGSRFSILTTGGTTALQLALEALDV